MMDGTRGHLEIGAVVVEIVDGRADEHADAHGLEARAPDGGAGGLREPLPPLRADLLPHRGLEECSLGVVDAAFVSEQSF